MVERKMWKTKRNSIVGFEIVIMIVSIFAAVYFVALSEVEIVSASNRDPLSFFDYVYNNSGTINESYSWSSYPISANSNDVGCCFISNDGEVCGTASPENCLSDSPFAEGVLCAATSFCEKGCCYDEGTGIYDKNVLEFNCPTNWIKDPNCNIPGARLGCCVLGDKTVFETRGQCEVDSLVRALGNNENVDWREEVNEGGCLFLANTQKKGACIFGNGGCSFVNEGDCFSSNGEFYEDVLCTSPSLNTSCEMTQQTRCIDGVDQVYFVDSCGNAANVYDSARVNDPIYWNMVVAPEDICGDEDIEGGNANSQSCGNCNRFAGGICASAINDGFEADVGSFYCKDTSCMYDGVKYDNGESWCVYDGKIGDGDDVVGSRHWKYVCSQGVVQVEPCADYRNQICIQSKEFEVDGEMVEFDNAACVANNWRECININSNKENAMEECKEALNCRVETVDIADKFKFDICLPRYPGGFALNNERYQTTAEKLCGMADQTCTVVYKPKRWGGCELVANGGCLEERFGQEMNDFCRGLGDCGGSVNIVGEWSDNYRIRNAPDLSEGWIGKLKALAELVPGQFAEVEDYSEYLEAAGIWGGVDDPETPEIEEGIDMSMIGQGISGIGYAAGWAASSGYLGVGITQGAGLAQVGGEVFAESAAEGLTAAQSTGASMSAFAGVAIGAGIGMVVGAMLANYLGLSPGGSILMSVGGALVGAGAAIIYFEMGKALMAIAPYLIWIGVILIIFSLFFGGDDCDPVEVQFECKPWQAPIGSNDCEKCNGDPLKPCSRYRCESLGTGCELLNEGSGDELCVAGNPNDASAPVIRRQTNLNFGGANYKDEYNGFSVTNSNGGCINAYENMIFGISTSEPTQCRFDAEMVEFDEMRFDLGGSSYLYNHTGVFNLPDPSHGQSQGLDWNGEMVLYVKCRDRAGLVSPDYYNIKTCVNEGDDVTGPRVVASEPENGKMISFDAVNKEVLIATNELSTCKWDFSDVDYSLMANSFECNDELFKPSNDLGYSCSGIFPVENGSNNYYVRCMDQPWLNESSERNVNSQSFVFNLQRPIKKISIDKIKPDSDFEISTDLTTIELKVATSGGGDYHFCSYSFSGYDKMIQMFETGESKTHSQVLNRIPGVQNIYVECHDETGDVAQSSTSFVITKDSSTPQIARVWQEGGFVNVVLTEEGECRFSFDNCRFAWSEGYDIGKGKELRFAVVRGEKYYIKCTDEFGNYPNGCSVEVFAL